ncbi:MAG: CDP-glycerol glycerophosphotransferase family protein [Thermodesulfovibrionales bacterium]|nr:CDP-glycerol glycerophosphotransferase family protein [Thermodesulfovibrionales bacterium]
MALVRKYISYLIFLFVPVFSLISRMLSIIFPPVKGLWVFGSWQGNKYADNARYLFEYVNREHPEIRAVWLTGNPEVLEHVRSLGFNARMKSGLIGYFLTLRAEAVVLTHFPSAIWCDVNRFALSSRSNIIQLYHGIHMKKFGYKEEDIPLKRKVFAFLFSTLYDCNFLIATARETRRIYASIFPIPKERIVVTGYPRHDAFFDGESALTWPRKDKLATKILYAPTFRVTTDKELALISDYGFDHGMIEDFLVRHNAELYIRLHPSHDNASGMEIVRKIEECSRIHFFNQGDITELMRDFDIVVSDYSSVYLDFIFMDRPVVFAAFDLEDYVKHIGFYYDYSESSPGPKAGDWPEVMAFIEEAMEEPDKYAADRKRVREFFHDFYDGDNSRRVFEEILRRMPGRQA